MIIRKIPPSLPPSSSACLTAQALKAKVSRSSYACAEKNNVHKIIFRVIKKASSSLFKCDKNIFTKRNDHRKKTSQKEKIFS